MAHHGVSGLVGKVVTELELNCDADEYYKVYKHHQLVPNEAVSHLFTGVKALEGGDGLSPVHIKEWSYILEGKTMTAVEESTYDDETRTISHRIVEGDVMKDYKKFDEIVVAKPKPDGHGSIVSISIMYEKINEDSPTPFDILKTFHQNILDLSAHICASE
ncbi:major latex protein 15-like [Papaver somniferum]|uniref:major latex protein 15-like n=1 Tax=Papaver somniferum TaxID=3469 RepID=UPI000E705CE7|nr:major latex protein 15-like [Papaver somniferum]XP_026444222.1 major latex protein 15-like [Papaver somniferum]